MTLRQAQGHNELNRIMNKKIKVSAPGKLMLFGEHAVVYSHPCLVTAVNQRMYVSVELLEAKEFYLDAPEVKVLKYQKPMNKIGKGEIAKGAKFVEIAIKNFAERYGLKNGIKVTTKSEFSSLFGFGSSSAATVCVIKALSELTNTHLSDKQLFDLSYKTVLDIQGKGSGFDIAAAIYGGTLYFFTAGKIIKKLKINSLPLIVAYSGVKADTVTLIKKVKEQETKYPKIIKNIYNNIEDIVELAKKAIEKKDWQQVGELMNINQGYLESLGVSTQKLSAMIYVVKNNGGYGAKLSGAGGGDCIIALAPQTKIGQIKKVMKSVGGEFIKIGTNAQGVRLES